MRARTVLAGSLSAGLLATAVAVALPASAATATTYYGMSTAGDFVKVKIDSGKVVSKSVLHAAATDQLIVPQAFEGGWVAGTVLDGHGQGQLFTYDVKNAKWHLLSDLTGNVQSATLFDGGNKVAYSAQVGHHYEINKVSDTGANEANLYKSSTNSPWDIAITETGKRLFMAYDNENTFKGDAVEITSSGLKSLTGGKKLAFPEYYGSLEISPDGTHIAFTKTTFNGGEHNAIHVAPLKTDNDVAVGYDGAPGRVAWNPAGSKVVFGTASGWKSITMKGALSGIAGTAKLANPVLGA